MKNAVRNNPYCAPEFLGMTTASTPDLSAFRQLTPFLQDCTVYADKAYLDSLEKGNT